MILVRKEEEMNILTDFILSPGFTAFTTVAGLFGDAAALFIAAYALYLSAFSQNIDHISSSFHGSTFYGTVGQ